MYAIDRSDSLAHHGIKGQKWGVRRKDYVAKGIYQHHPDGYNYNDNRSKLTVSRNFREGTNVSRYKRQLNALPKYGYGADVVLRKKAETSRDNGKRIIASMFSGIVAGVAIGHLIDTKKAENRYLHYDKLKDQDVSTNGKKIVSRILLGGLVGAAIGVAANKKKENEKKKEDRERSERMDEYFKNKMGMSDREIKKLRDHQAKANTKLFASDSDSDVTKKVKKDWNRMSDKEFMQTYQTTKKEYLKRVAKYGDPYARRMRR